ncbi:MAG TPA: hypothetical protein VE035_17405 [Puia sp.]|nr:hypothetical protein [Puia sp.]
MRPFLLAFLISSATFFSAGSLRAQRVIDVTNADAVQMGKGLPVAVSGGEPFSMAKFVRVTAGTPFFYEGWMRGMLVLGSGKAYANLLIRINLLDNTVIYQDANGQELIATTPLRRIMLRDSITGKEYNFVLGSEMNNAEKSYLKIWFQVLVNDRISLCKQLRKTILENTPYGSATTEQTISTTDIYFVYKDGQLIPIKKWSEFLDVFSDRKDKMSPFVSTNHLRGRSEQDYIQVVNYYNSLLKGLSALR